MMLLRYDENEMMVNFKHNYINIFYIFQRYMYLLICNLRSGVLFSEEREGIESIATRE